MYKPTAVVRGLFGAKSDGVLVCFLEEKWMPNSARTPWWEIREGAVMFELKDGCIENMAMNGTAWVTMGSLWTEVPFVMAIHPNREDWGIKLSGIQVANLGDVLASLEDTENITLAQPLFGSGTLDAPISPTLHLILTSQRGMEYSVEIRLTQPDATGITQRQRRRRCAARLPRHRVAGARQDGCKRKHDDHSPTR